MVSIHGIIVIICPLVCGIQEKILMQINLQSRNRDIENKLMVTKGEKEGGIN